MALIIKRAETREEIEAAQRLACEVLTHNIRAFSEDDYINYTNRYLNCSIYFIAKIGEDVVGTMKLVSHDCTGHFPIEEAFELPDFVANQRQKTLEVSRAAIKKEQRGDKASHQILLGLLRTIYEYAEQNHYSYLCAAMFPLILKTLINQIGWKFKWIGAGNSKIYHNFLIPVILEIKDENVNFEVKK